MSNKNKKLDDGLERMLKNPAYANSNMTIIKNALPQKMSAVLLDFARPLLDMIDLSDQTATKSAIMVAVGIWNYSIINDKRAPKRPLTDKLDKKMIKSMTEQAFQDSIGEWVFNELLTRKKTLYPDNYRIIGDFDLRWNESGSEFYLSVITSD